MADSLLLSHPLFREASEENITAILEGTPLRPVPSGSLVDMPGESRGCLHLLLEGRLKAYQLTPDGREVVLELIEPGGFDGMLSVVGQRGHFTEAVQDSLVASMPRATVERLLSADPHVGHNLLWSITTRLGNREEHLESMALRDPTQRLARQLLALAETTGRRDGGHVVLTQRLTHQTLADMIGLRRETVTLHLHGLTETGAVGLRDGHFLLNEPLLRRLVQDSRLKGKSPSQ